MVATSAPPLERASKLARFALVGSPNSGKTTLFNALTGLRAKTGNYAGVTVERHSGSLRVDDARQKPAEIIDLPGTYSLDALSEDEAVTVRVLRGELDDELGGGLDGVLVVADATTLERSLPLLAEVLALGRPTLLVLTMIDELRARGGTIDIFELRRAIGIPVVGIVGTKGVGLDDLKLQLAEVQTWSRAPTTTVHSTTTERFAWADDVLGRAARLAPGASQLTQRIDSVLLHRVFGPLFFFAFVLVFFQAVFSGADPLMDLLDSGIGSVADALANVLPPGLLSSLLCDGVVRGVGSVLVFLPQIVLLFAVILFLEASGYMARAAFVVDRLMGFVGLEGRCFIALLSSYACAVPGILATRSIPSPRHRLITILAAPLTTCSARLPVYALLIAAFVEPTPVFGPLTAQGLTLLALYLLGAFSTLAAAALLGRGLVRGRSLPFYQELPPYRWPSWRTIAQQIWQRVRIFLKRAGTVILAASILLWLLLSFPRRDFPDGTPTAEQQQVILENSYAAQVGRAMEPVFAPLGFDWRINVGLLGSFAAREVMVSTLAQIYGHGDADEGDEGLTSRVREAMDAPTAFALLVWFVYALQCISTIAVMRRETASWRWPIIALVAMGVFGWCGGYLAYTLAS
ncbi:MAG TPA: ferrous iron transporter B [Planctomycetota bacterium]|nr:ferrous iron transporter B [Planctomycetota bacterium]